MTTPDDVTLAFWNEQREQLRQAENQRSVLTNYVLTIAAAVGGFVIQQRYPRLSRLPLRWLSTGLHLGAAFDGLVPIILTALEGG